MKRNVPRRTLRDRRIDNLRREIRHAEAALETMRLLVARTAEPTPQRLDALATSEKVITALQAQLDRATNADAYVLMSDMVETVIRLAEDFRREDRAAARDRDTR